MEFSWACHLQVLVLLWISTAQGLLRCDCNTQECKDAGMTTCIARKACYTELYQNVLNRGCDPTPLACENRKPSGLHLEWPALYCCRDKNLCNKNAVPTVTTPDEDDDTGPASETDDVAYSADQLDDFQEDDDLPLDDLNPGAELPAGVSRCDNPEPELRSHARTKIVNPIYIAVPVAGVCVLLALIIFAMYLLRRRTDYHHPNDSSFNSHHHCHHDHGGTVASGQKKGGDGQPLQQQQQQVPHSGQHHHPGVVPHHCHCTCKKQPIVALPHCAKGSNRCTDSERSSSGSETRLFLQS